MSVDIWHPKNDFQADNLDWLTPRPYPSIWFNSVNSNLSQWGVWTVYTWPYSHLYQQYGISIVNSRLNQFGVWTIYTQVHKCISNNWTPSQSCSLCLHLYFCIMAVHSSNSLSTSWICANLTAISNFATPQPAPYLFSIFIAVGLPTDSF